MITIKEFHGYIVDNLVFIPNYCDRYQHDKASSTTFVESTVNYVVSKRFVKKQQMHWTQHGAHLLRQTRVEVLNDDLRETFCHWYPEIKSEEQAALKAARQHGSASPRFVPLSSNSSSYTRREAIPWDGSFGNMSTQSRLSTISRRRQ